MCDNSAKSLGSGRIGPSRERSRVEIVEVDNGFIVHLGYGMQTKVASDNEQALVIVAEFLATLKPATN